MVEPPPELVALRCQVGTSFTWRRLHRGRVVAYSERAYQALAPSARAECSWRPDPKLVEALRDAEQAFTRTFAEKSV